MIPLKHTSTYLPVHEYMFSGSAKLFFPIQRFVLSRVVQGLGVWARASVSVYNLTAAESVHRRKHGTDVDPIV